MTSGWQVEGVSWITGTLTEVSGVLGLGRFRSGIYQEEVNTGRKTSRMKLSNQDQHLMCGSFKPDQYYAQGRMGRRYR